MKTYILLSLWSKKEAQDPCVKTSFNIFGLLSFNATFNNISFISWRSVFWWRKPEYPEKTTDLPQLTDN